ncbi:MAG: hypothetical protein EBS79_05025 [Gammaproteobacteria bacterium]|nr:hypothetical protein [Gammaproteobacteria bacterium]
MSSERLKGRLFRALIKIRSGGDGHISIRITIAKDITLETDFNIAPTSPIFKAANPLPYGTIPSKKIILRRRASQNLVALNRQALKFR